jgi:hydrogenase expression/formation protein HypC
MCLGTVGQITTVNADRCVQIHSGDREFSASLLAVSDPVGPGDWVLVHSGLVLARLTEHEAMDALELREPTSQGAP